MLRLYNTLGREVQDFHSISPGNVRLYCCGPTVYSYAHIGNLRTYVFEDILRRTLEQHGYEVQHVMNVTDVGHLTDDGDEGEDKMIVGARERGMTVWEIANHFTDSFFADTDSLNIKRPDTVCKATDHVSDMIDLVSTLGDRGLSYQADGNVYFSVDAFPDYGRLALLDRQELKPGARIKVDTAKRNPRDFVLWFTNSKFEHQAMMWDSPWGRGYPGWHLECSAMSMKYLGNKIDIHCGGVDHISVHHTNEIAQSEGATGEQWVNYWMHGEFLIMDDGRMGKSEGNALTLSTVIERGFDPLDYRYYLLMAHYRTQLTFSWDAVTAAQSARAALAARLQGLAGEIAEGAGVPDASDTDTVGESARARREAIQAAIADDLNIPRAIGELWTLIKDDEVPAADRLAVAFETDEVLGLRLKETATKLQVELTAEHHTLIAQREAAREAKDYAKADQLREELSKQGITIEDTPEGTKWRVG